MPPLSYGPRKLPLPMPAKYCTHLRSTDGELVCGRPVRGLGCDSSPPLQPLRTDDPLRPGQCAKKESHPRSVLPLGKLASAVRKIVDVFGDGTARDAELLSNFVMGQ